MKHIYSHIIKKEYQKPTIEEILIDREMSLVMYSPPPEEPGGGEEPLPVGNASTSIDYGTNYQAEAPFGGSKPAY